MPTGHSGLPATTTDLLTPPHFCGTAKSERAKLQVEPDTTGDMAMKPINQETHGTLTCQGQLLKGAEGKKQKPA